MSERDSHARAYAKGWEEIEGYLLVAGVVDTVLALEEPGPAARVAHDVQGAVGDGAVEVREVHGCLASGDEVGELGDRHLRPLPWAVVQKVGADPASPASR